MKNGKTLTRLITALFVIFCLIITSCENIIPGLGGTISVTIDDEKKEFKYEVFAEWRSTELFIYGVTYSGESSRKHHGEMNITIPTNSNSITTKTYSSSIVYVINFEGYAEVYVANLPVTITSSNSSHIEGNFSGTVTDEDYHKSKKLTNGSFDVKF